jgi:hypothetical protein
MNMDTFTQKLIVAVVSLVAGSILTAIATRLRNKSAVFRYVLWTNRVATAVEDPIFGSVRVTWNGQEQRNLYTAAIKLTNTSWRDFENITLRMHTGPETCLLTERASIENTTYLLEWSGAYRQHLGMRPGEQATQAQTGILWHSREYAIPVLNRGQTVYLNYICTRPADDQTPTISIDTLAKGVKLKCAVVTNTFWGVPMPIAVSRGLVATVITVILCILFLKQIWLVAVICAVAGLITQVPGALIYKLERRIKAAISE